MIFLTPAVEDGLSLESGWQPLSSGLLDSSQYSEGTQQCCSLDGLGSSPNFQHFQPPFQALRESSKCASYNWYHSHPDVPQLSKPSVKV